MQMAIEQDKVSVCMCGKFAKYLVICIPLVLMCWQFKQAKQTRKADEAAEEDKQIGKKG